MRNVCDKTFSSAAAYSAASAPPVWRASSSGQQSKQYAVGQPMQRKSLPPAAELRRPHVQHACHGQYHVPLGTALNPTHSR